MPRSKFTMNIRQRFSPGSTRGSPEFGGGGSDTLGEQGHGALGKAALPAMRAEAETALPCPTAANRSLSGDLLCRRVSQASTRLQSPSPGRGVQPRIILGEQHTRTIWKGHITPSLLPLQALNKRRLQWRMQGVCSPRHPAFSVCVGACVFTSFIFALHLTALRLLLSRLVHANCALTSEKLTGRFVSLTEGGCLYSHHSLQTLGCRRASPSGF
jgi:hypothetical protein